MSQSDFDHTYRASELVALLQGFIAAHGDVPVVLKDPDTGWRMEVGCLYRDAKPTEGYPARIQLYGDYHTRPRGAKPL